MTLDEVLNGVGLRGGIPAALAGCTVAGLDYDSRRVGPDTCSSPLRVIAPTAAGSPPMRWQGRPGGGERVAETGGLRRGLIEVERGRRAMSIAARNFYRAAAEAARLTGITGTNAKPRHPTSPIRFWAQPDGRRR